MKVIYQVCVLHTSRDYFDYEASEFQPKTGARVWVPFRNKTRLGIVIGQEITATPHGSLKSIRELIDKEPLISKELMELCLWVGTYYQAPLSEVLPLALPKKYRLGHASQLPMGDFYQLIMPLEEAKSGISMRSRKQLQLLEYLAHFSEPVSKSQLTQQGYNSSQLLAFVKAGILHLSQHPVLPLSLNNALTPPLNLNSEQAQALSLITNELHHFTCFLLQGITGSGKTEVYLQVISKVLEQGKQVLILVPEIGLTPQLLARFTARFSQTIVVLHSNLTETERQIAWQLANENKAQMVIGTRSAIFTPMPHLGLIVIDEEHDASLKQMEGVRYSARDTALMRASLLQIPIILGSATPSLESIHNCQQKKYTLIKLNQKALTDRPLHYQLIDLRSQALQHGLAAPVLQIIEEHLNNNNQVLIFINRRGFAPVLLCHQCGWMVNCKACDSHLTVHRQNAQMICHHCGLTQAIPQHCLSCNSRELIPVGAGTQRVYEFLSNRFPQTSVMRLDRDAIKKKHALAEHLDKINKGEAQLIVGTQMLAKGHHFPRLSLVVILDADTGLHHQDFRALEHLGQLLTQVSGRAGRAEHPGHVVIQTHWPHHPLLNVLIQKGYGDFAQELLNTRLQAKLPPFHYLAMIRAQGSTPKTVLEFLNATKNQIQINSVTVMGPAPAPLARKANQYRMQLLIKAPSRKALKNSLTQLREWLTMNKQYNKVRWNVDVDPMDLS